MCLCIPTRSYESGQDLNINNMFPVSHFRLATSVSRVHHITGTMITETSEVERSNPIQQKGGSLSYMFTWKY